MKSDHIDNQRLCDVVKGSAILEKNELQHLSNCEECLEMIRVLVRQQISNSEHP